ncbi:MAG: winged helix-turn-helix transcriptional regulator [Euryarchaeota archaeon]|nr:winged helix-turn-helix transcriptional regulator [Euryarchaeota archaeon]
MKKLLWWLIAGTKGGLNRAKIIEALHKRPYNAHQLCEMLGVDYTTARHHIEVLEKDKLVSPTGDKYGNMYFLTPVMEENYKMFEEILEQLGNNKISVDRNKGGE